MKAFYQLLINTFISGTTTTLVWFALSLWVYTQTSSVLANSIMSGVYLIATTATGIWFGSLVDHNKKKTMMIVSTATTLAAFLFAFILYLLVPSAAFTNHASPWLWFFIAVVFTGVIAGNIRAIALPTVVTLLVDENERDKANGMVGTVNGVTFLLASVISGFLLATSGMYWIFILTLVLLLAAIAHLFALRVPEKGIAHVEGVERKTKREDFFETFTIVKAIPGLFALILFTSFNNFLGGVFMPLMDPYGLSLVSLQVWGILWGFLSLGFILGGLIIAKRGLGKNPLRSLLTTNAIIWTICIFFTVQPSIALLVVGMFLYITLVPFIEASEHTIIQKIVPQDRQGRVFGLAQSIETSASPLTALAIGPITQFFFIPFMTTGWGAQNIGSWFGVGPGRGIALVFITAGVLGLGITLLAMRSRAYALLSKQYTK